MTSQKPTTTATLPPGQLSIDQLQKLRSQSLSTWGTDDLDELKLKLVKLQDENEARRAKYQSDLQSIEAKLNEVDEKYQSLRDTGRESE